MDVLLPLSGLKKMGNQENYIMVTFKAAHGMHPFVVTLRFMASRKSLNMLARMGNEILVLLIVTLFSCPWEES
jgi:hypothetical protein